ncbi:MAG TPA: choice-of-anchor tandem repeat GloVer-containing protein [Terriglobia bacterium]
MRSKIVSGMLIGLLAVLSIAAGIPAQDRLAAHEKPEQPGSAVRFKTLFTFDNADGAEPEVALVQGTDGNLYGTAYAGGLYDNGTVFKITPQGALTTIYNFCAQTNCPDGNEPDAALTLGTDGNFYGTTYFGGANADACQTGCGVVFKITPAGAMTTLYSFCALPGCADGAAPGALVQGNDGNFYGTILEGGSANCVNTCGTVFKITPAGVLTTLYKFTGADAGGYYPNSFERLVQGTDGNFYGTTTFGGPASGCGGSTCGTVFKITPEGALTTLYNFQGGAGESENPGGDLIQATDGNFYGNAGGGYFNSTCFDSCGTIFKMTPEGVVTTLVSLDGTDGVGPVGLIQATNGNFYIVAEGGGPHNSGTILEVTPEGVVTVLHDFSNGSDGSFPFSGVVQATNGTFYGDTASGGTIYSLSTGLGPFVESVPTAGKAGGTVKILGNNLKFATGVTFNGVATSFTAKSGTYIEATVPAGATTGPIVVTLPSGTLTSNVNFQVLP